jgi:hypothetical protein
MRVARYAMICGEMRQNRCCLFLIMKVALTSYGYGSYKAVVYIQGPFIYYAKL